MKNDEQLRQAIHTSIDQGLSHAEARPSLQGKVLKQIRGEIYMKKKISMALVLAVLLCIALAGAAVAVGLGAFSYYEKFKGDQPGVVERLEHVDEVAVPVDAAIALVTPQESPQGNTVKDQLLQAMAGRAFELTIDEAYCNGNKLYFAYTFRHDDNLAFYGEGAPDGFDTWDMEWPGQSFGEIASFGNAQFWKEEAQWFETHENGWFASTNCYVGDGADLADGTGLRIWDSWLERVDDHTMHAYYEVELPELVEAQESIDIVLTVFYNASINYVDETGVYWASVSPSTNRGVLRVPLTVSITGDVQTISGAGDFDVYSAQADLLISAFDVAGTVVITPPTEWLEAISAFDPDTSGEYIQDYVLIAGDTEIVNNWGGVIPADDGAYTIELRFDLPEDTRDLKLVPVYRSGFRQENEAIALK